MATLKGAIEEIQDEVGSVSGIRKAPDQPPEKLTHFPYAIAYPDTGFVQQQSEGFRTHLHDIVVEIHVARKDLPRDIKAVIGYVETIPAEIWGNLGNYTNIQTIGNISYEFTTFEYAGIETIGWRFTLEGVKFQS